MQCTSAGLDNASCINLLNLHSELSVVQMNSNWHVDNRMLSNMRQSVVCSVAVPCTCFAGLWSSCHITDCQGEEAAGISLKRKIS